MLPIPRLHRLLSILPLAGMMGGFLCVASCAHHSDLSEYSVTECEAHTGELSGGEVILEACVSVVVSGPEERMWQVTLTTDGGKCTKVVARTGRRAWAPCYELSREMPETTVSVSVGDLGSGEVLFTRRNLSLRLEEVGEGGGGDEPSGPEGPEEPGTSLSVSSLVLHAGERTENISVGEGKAAFEVQKGDAGVLVLSFVCSGMDASAVSLSVAGGGDGSLRIPDGAVDLSGTEFRIPFRAVSEGSGNVSLSLKGEGLSAGVNVVFTVLPDGRVIELVPDVFLFAEQNEAMGTVVFMGFAEGKRCDVVIRYRERSGGEAGRREYLDVPADRPLRVLLWEAGKAAEWQEADYWAELYEPGGDEPLWVTEPVTVRPFRPEFLWWESDGKAVREGEAVRSTSTGSACRLGVTVGRSRQEAVTRITVRDLRQGRSFVSTSAEPETEGCFVTDMVHPSKGRHDFVATFETAEGTYSYSFSQSFCDVWTVLPFVDGHSLYAELRGPERTVGERCELRISVDIYAVFDYTVAVERDGEKINEPARWWHFVERRGLDYTIEKGTAQGEMKIQNGWVNTSVRHIKSVAEGLDWSVTGGTATRWVSSRTVQYKPQASKAGILLTLGVNESFRTAGNDVVLDLSRIQGTLDERGIVY